MVLAEKWCNDHTPMSYFPSTFNHHLSPMHLFFYYFLEFSPPFRPHTRYWSNVSLDFRDLFKFSFSCPFWKGIDASCVCGASNLECLGDIVPTKENPMLNIKGNQIELTKIHLGYCFFNHEPFVASCGKGDLAC
jgi:hypothetical protein